MAPNDLVSPAQLADFPGAPFTQDVVDAAVAKVRAKADWHIAPEREETVTVDSRGGALLWLPTRYLTSVTEVRDVSGDEPVVITGWRAFRNGKLVLSDWPLCWPRGLGVIEADIVHGYGECPAQLLPLIAGYCQASVLDPTVSQESTGPFSASFRDGTTDVDPDGVLAGLSLTWGVA